MSDAIYPENLPGRVWPRIRTPIYSTAVQTTPSGREWRKSNTTYPRYRYTLRYAFLREDSFFSEFAPLFGFYRARRGAYDTFLFNDPDDRTATNQAFGIGDGVTTQFQLIRTLGGAVDPVSALSGAAQIYSGGALVSSGVTVSSSGAVNFATAPAVGVALTWTGAFYWRCRFDDDSLSFEQFAKGLWKTGKVDLLTVLP